jgi:hypothetical protein
MRFSKLLQFCCVLGVLTGSARAQLTPTEEKNATEALRQKIAELNGVSPATTGQGTWLAQAQVYLRDGRLSQSQYDKLQAQINSYDANPKPAELEKIKQRLAQAEARSPRNSPAAHIDAKERIALHEEQRAVQKGDPNSDAAYARDLARRALQGQSSSRAATPPAGPVIHATPAAPLDDDAYARDLERRTRLELGASPKSVAPAPVMKPAPTPAAPVQAAKPVPSPVTKPVPAPSAPAPSRPVVAKPAPDSPAPTVAKTPTERPKPVPKASKEAAKTTKAAPAPATAPAAPAGPLTKREKLAELLERYKADKISPTQYQEERARILAEP